MGKLEKPVLIVGHMHGGTCYMARILQSIGVDVSHYPVGSDGSTSWVYTHLHRDEYASIGLPADTIVIQQTRDVLRVINSVQGEEERVWKDVRNRAQNRGIDWDPMDDPLPIRAMKYWLIWSKFASNNAQFRYKVEEIEDAFPKILELLGLELVPVPPLYKTINKHEQICDYSWSELKEIDHELCTEVITMAKSYGYKIEKEVKAEVINENTLDTCEFNITVQISPVRNN